MLTNRPSRVCKNFTWLAIAAAAAYTLGCRSDPLDEVRALQAKGAYQASIEPLRDLTESTPDDPEVHYRYGLALSLAGQGRLSLWPLKKAMESADWRVAAGLALAAAQIGAGNHDASVEASSAVLEFEADSIAALVLRALARVHSRRDYEGALADAERALELDPDNGDALVPRAVALLALERVEEAGEALEALEGRYRDDTLGLSGSAGFCAAGASFSKEKGDLEIAEKRYDECLEAFPIDGVVIQEAISFFDQIRRPERVREILETALEGRPKAHTYRWALAERLRAEEKREESEALLRAGTELDSPRDVVEAWRNLAAFFTNEEEYDQAVDALENAVALVPKASAQLLFTYADILILADRYDEAKAVAEKMDLPAHRELVLGRVELERGRPGQALKHFGEGIRLWPDNAVARYYAATAAEQIGDFDRAIEDYRYAIRVDHQATDAHLRLARLYLAEGDHEQAITMLFQRAGGRQSELESGLLLVRIQAQLGRWRGFRQLPKILLLPENWGEAVAALAQGVRQHSGAAAGAQIVDDADRMDLADPANAPALETFVECLADTGDTARGLSLVEAGLRAHPESARFHTLHGRVLSVSGASDKQVRPAYQRALELDAEEPRALYRLAQIAARSGSSEAAVSLYDRAIAADPDNSDAVHELATLLVSMALPAEAEARLRTLLVEHPYDSKAALMLAKLRLQRGVRDDRTIELAKRAVRFGGGEEANVILERAAGSPANQQPPG